MPTLIFSAFIIVGRDAGSTTIVNICSLLAPSVFMSSCFSPVISLKPASTLIIVTTKDISSAITIMLVMPAPNHTISIGPSAILGSAFNTTRYGSSTRLIAGLHQSVIAISVPAAVPSTKPSTVS